MLYFSDKLIKSEGGVERFLRTPLRICLSTARTLEASEIDDNSSYPNKNISELIDSIAATHNNVSEVRSKAAGETAIDPESIDMFKCPITGYVMEDPVVVSSGLTYEREAIMLHLDAMIKIGLPAISPHDIDRHDISDTTLVSNHLLACLIDESIQKRIQAGFLPPQRGLGGISRPEILASFTDPYFTNLRSVCELSLGVARSTANLGRTIFGESGERVGWTTGGLLASTTSAVGSTATTSLALITAIPKLYMISKSDFPPPPVIKNQCALLSAKSGAYRNHIGRSELDFDENNANSYLGHGGFGQVFRGHYRTYIQEGESWNPQLIEVAIKKFYTIACISQSEGPRRVARHCRDLNHRNLVKLYGLCEQRFQLFLIMELVVGTNLSTLLHDRPQEALPWATRNRIALDIADGLAYLHDRGIIHADIKPLNILLDHELNAKLTDFDLVKSVEDLSPSEPVSGTLLYMSPEVFRGIFSYRSDIWAFGVVLWEIALRRAPVFDEDVTLEAFLTGDPTRNLISHLNNDPSVPEGYSTLVSSCWSRQNEDIPLAGDISQTFRGMGV